MKLTPIEGSSVIKAHGYDPATGRLQIQFPNGSVHEFGDVSAEKYAAFTGASSPGKFFNSKIRPHHQGRKV